MHQPSYLKKGDKIGIIACARKISLTEIQPAIDFLKAWGLEVVLSKNLFKADNQFSGSDDERAEDFQMMLDDDSIKAVISARGGYGTLRIIDKIDFTHFKKHPKWIIGYSDITVLHSHIHNFGIETLHATMPINFMKNREGPPNLFPFPCRRMSPRHPVFNTNTVSLTTEPAGPPETGIRRRSGEKRSVSWSRWATPVEGRARGR